MHIINKILLYLFFITFISYGFSNLELNHAANFLCLSEAAYKDTLLSEQVRDSLIKISPETPFVIFDLNLSQKNINTLKKLKVNSFSSYSNMNNNGDLNIDNPHSEISQFLQGLGNSAELSNSASKIITKIIFQSLIGCKRERAHIQLISFSHTDAYDIPRWHRDGSLDGGYKIVMALKGPQTLFYPQALFHPSPEMQEFYFMGFNFIDWTKHRMALAKMLDMSQVISANHNQAVIFLMGDNGALHSEPPIHEDRLFLAISYDEEEIKELRR